MKFKDVQERWERFREDARERKAAKQKIMAADQHHGRFWLLQVPAMATICAAIVEVYWAFLFCIEATGRLEAQWATSSGSAEAASGAWHFLFDVQSAFVLVGLLCATVPIVMMSMIWLPVQFAMRGAGRWRRGTIIFVGLLANVLVIVSGTVVMNYNRQDQVREALVVEQSAAAQTAMLTANVDDLREELATLMNHRSTYVATAASVGAAAYERDYVAQARATRDPRLPLLERALGSARRADELRGQIRAARRDVATAAPAAASVANVEDNVGRELNTFAQYVEVWRPPFVAFICTLIGIFGAWWTLAMLERLNPKDVLRSGWADDSHRIEDLRDQEPVVPERDDKGRVKMKPPRRKFTEADTGEEVEQALIPQHYRTIKRNKRTTMEIQPDIPPDETGVDYDGGARIATTREEEQAMLGAMVEERESGERNALDSEASEKPASHSIMGVEQNLTKQDGDANTASPGVHVPVDAAAMEPAVSQPSTSSQPLTEEEQAELNQSLAALGELEPALDGNDLQVLPPQPEPQSVEHDAVADDSADAEGDDHEGDELSPVDDDVATEPVDHEDLHENQERDEPETRANRLLQPAK